MPEHTFKLVPFLPAEFPQLKEKIKAGKIDYVILPPVMYVDLQMSVGASKLLTLLDKNRIGRFGSVIISNKKSNITTLSQIKKNHRIAAVAPLGTGGWLIGYDTLMAHHIDPLKNGNKVIFLGEQKRVVQSIIDSRADVGIIRTGLLEQWQREKKFDMQKLNILNKQNHAYFPYVCSSKLYPQWCFAKTINASDELSRKIVVELLGLPGDSNVAKSARYFQWTAPDIYKSVYDLIRRLGISNYANTKSQIIKELLEEHKEIIILLVIIALFLFLAREYHINRKLRREKKKKEALLEQINYQVYHDTLTHLLNRTHLEKITQTEDQFSLILLNINNLSYINMAYGFETGDKLLIRVAEILKGNFSAHSAYRLNSDEFALLFDEKIDLEAQIKEIQNYFHTNTIQIDTLVLHISFSYGAAYDRKKIISNSALALKQAKENGKDQFRIFDQERDKIDYAKRESFIASHNLLHKALQEDKIVPYFQGIRDNKTKTLTKFEVLARIEQDGKIISPYVFLETARLSGFISNITKAMIDKSFKIMANNNYIFSINITEDDLNRNYLCDYLNEKSLQYGIKPERVIIEILEGISTIGQKNNLQQLKLIKSEGYALAIDDFGAEYSNFERTLELNIDYLKIDAKYIKDIDVNQRSYNVTKSIVFFAKQSGIPCIAEFVHNASVQKVIEELDIEYSQGYYFSKPSKMPGEY
ncbi:MAG: EAL domain-containing protein [Sulfurospirillum sp.]